MKAIRQGFIGIVAVTVLTVSLPNIGKGEERQLTPQEVSNTFIGTPWHGTVGAFLFKENGTYTYKRFDRKSPLGVWSYKMNKDGSLTGGNTTYTFYRDGDDYRYFHSRSGKYYPAIPNRTFE